MHFKTLTHSSRDWRTSCHLERHTHGPSVRDLFRTSCSQSLPVRENTQIFRCQFSEFRPFLVSRHPEPRTIPLSPLVMPLQKHKKGSGLIASNMIFRPRTSSAYDTQITTCGAPTNPTFSKR